MQTYSLLIQDRRFLAPTVELVDAVDDDEASTLARERLDASAHYLGVEVRADDVLKRWLVRPSRRTWDWDDELTV